MTMSIRAATVTLRGSNEARIRHPKQVRFAAGRRPLSWHVKSATTNTRRTMQHKLELQRQDMRPWKKLQSNTVLKDRWLHVTADRCELPNGITLDPYYVMHETDWVHVFALDANGHLLVVRQYRYAADTTTLELPGGVIDDGEEPLLAAQRELLEETGYSSTDWSFVCSMFANPARQTNKVHLFLARNVTATGRQNLDEAEEIECSLQTLAAVESAIEGGEFSQALHIASYYRCLRLLHDQNAVGGSAGSRQ
ncbi:NUDIX hydrolase [Uliginosibacterium sp. H3]|uniref:NUDIX hydrolase n=1 Tax=Uliginosibacterium silvisoli TaxID=3114758 RepID=A0ABU6JZE6_9RHOO|nr:NUDIX hydrolase [Uliginosibacterium sp. H3]